MKLSLQVTTQGATEGKVIPITVPQFTIGRDPQCHLRPASALISKKHCTLQIRDGKAYVRDHESTNGTLVNDQRVEGEIELKNQDTLKVGPLTFVVRIDVPTSVDKTTPLPKPKAPALDDESVAEMLLSMQEDDVDEQATTALGTAAVSPDSTQLEIPTLPPDSKPAAGKTPPPKPAAAANTQSAAEAILAKYARRNRK